MTARSVAEGACGVLLSQAGLGEVGLEERAEWCTAGLLQQQTLHWRA